MRKRRFSWVLAMLTIWIALAPVADAKPSPKDVQIEDPTGDANYVNDQALGGSLGVVPRIEDHSGPVDLSSAGDLVKVWFSNNSNNIFVHILTEAPPRAEAPIYFIIEVNPTGELFAPFGSGYCLMFRASVGAGNDHAELLDLCTDGSARAAKIRVTALKDGSGLTTISVDRRFSAAFEAGRELVETRVQTRSHPSRAIQYPVIDNTKAGSSYRIN